MKSSILLILISYFILSSPSQSEENITTITIGNFSKESISSITPSNWSPLTFDSIDKETAYFLYRDNNKTIFKAVSNSSASGYIHKISVNPKEFPTLTWQWKIDNLISKANINTKSGDDYPARIYITFEYDMERLSGWEKFKVEAYYLSKGVYPPLAVLNYVWDNKQPIGYSTPNAYTDRVQMIVVQSGDTKVGKWVTQQVNIYDDYVRVFGETPGKITAIAIMTDTDNTMESATAYYGDIHLSKSTENKAKKKSLQN